MIQIVNKENCIRMIDQYINVFTIKEFFKSNTDLSRQYDKPTLIKKIEKKTY